MNQGHFHTLNYHQIGSREARSLSLKEMPGVYAWYRGFSRLRGADSAEEFLDLFAEMAQSKLSDKFSGKLGYLYDLTIQEQGGELSKKKAAQLERIANDAEARNCFSRLLESVTFMQSPLYIGKAARLRDRVASHVDGSSSDLRERLSKAGIDMADCLLRFKYVEIIELEMMSTAEDSYDDVVYLLEEVLTRFSPAAFVRRPG